MALLDGLGNALKRLDCAVTGNAAYVFGSAGLLQGLDQGLAVNVINGYRRLRGCDPVNDPQPPSAPYAGGQCDCAVYRIQFTLRNEGGGGEALFDFFAKGPIRGFEVVQASGPPGASVPTDLRVSCRGLGATGSCEAQGSRTFNQASYQPGVYIDNIVLSGDPEGQNCGNAPGDFPPPTSPVFNINFDYTDEGDNIVNVTVPIQFNPFTINFNGDVTFPIEFSLGGVDFNGDVSFFPDFSLNVSGPKFGRGGNGRDLPEGDPSDERPEAAPEAIIVGAVVLAEIVRNGASTGVDFTGGPDIFIPRLGSLKFAYSLGGATFWSNDIDVKGTRVFIPCPFSQGSDAIAVSPAPGVVLTATPIYGFPLATIGDVKVVLDNL